MTAISGSYNQDLPSKAQQPQSELIMLIFTVTPSLPPSFHLEQGGGWLARS